MTTRESQTNPPEVDVPDTAEYLAEKTGRPVEEFEYDGEIPDYDEKELIPADDQPNR